MKPVQFFKDPFRGGNHILVLTECFQWEDRTFTKLIPANSNFRHFSSQIFAERQDEAPWFGIEQEYTILQDNSRF